MVIATYDQDPSVMMLKKAFQSLDGMTKSTIVTKIDYPTAGLVLMGERITILMAI